MPIKTAAQRTIETGQRRMTEILPPAGHSNVGPRVFELLGQVLSYKQDKGLVERWNRNHQLSTGEHWRQKTKKASLVVANLALTHRTRLANKLTDNQPTFNINRVGLDSDNADDAQADKYDSLLKTCEYWWAEEEQQAVFENSVLVCEESGTVIEKVVFNPDREFGLGEVETITVDPFHFGMIPTSCRDPQKAEASLHFWPMSIREAKRRWPHMAEEIKADKETIEKLGDTREEAGVGGNKGRSFASRVSGLVKSFFPGDVSQAGEDDQLLVVEAWIKDYSRDESGDYAYAGNIRRVTVGCMGKVVFEDIDNPSINPTLPREQVKDTYLFDKVPFSFTVSVKDTVIPWGQSDYDQIMSLQEEINKTLSQFVLYKDRASRMKLINPKDSGVSDAELNNSPGIIRPTSAFAGQGIRYLDPPAIPTDLVQAVDIFKDLFFLVVGSFDLESAQTPGREVIAYKAIAALIEQASTMLRGKIRGYGKMIRERGRMYLSHVMNWYTEDRWITYEQDGEEVSKSIRGSDLIMPAKLTVVSGSTMPRSQVAEREEALALFEKGAIDQEELLKKMDWPDRKAVLKRMAMGPLSDFLTRLETIGASPEIVGALNEVAQMEPKEFEKGVKSGAIPPFPAIVAPPIQPEGASSLAPSGLPSPDAVEADKAAAEIRKIDAETALVEEKINTERVNQQVALAGVGFDDEKLKLERAKALQAMRTASEMPEPDNGKIEPSAEQRKGRDERGLKSNNRPE